MCSSITSSGLPNVFLIVVSPKSKSIKSWVLSITSSFTDLRGFSLIKSTALDNLSCLIPLFKGKDFLYFGDLAI